MKNFLFFSFLASFAILPLNAITSMELPHNEKLHNVHCGHCHSEKEREINGGAHAPKKSKYSPSCVNCHGAHQIKSSTDAISPTYMGTVHQLCGSCHGNSDLMKSIGVRIANPYKNYLLSEHGKALSEGISIRVPTCPICHKSHEILPSSNPQSPIYKQNVPETCGMCHKSIELEYKKSIHGKALTSGNLESPSCTNCHGEHDIEAPESPTSYPTNIAKTTCPQCHSSVRLSERYSLPSSRVKSYQASYHGIASVYGDVAVANCASCHGVHIILPSNDPESSIIEFIPQYGYFTPLQKFQYWGILTGCLTMGISGALLWSPVKTLMFFPKGFLDLMMVVHSREAQIIFLIFIL